MNKWMIWWAHPYFCKHPYPMNIWKSNGCEDEIWYLCFFGHVRFGGSIHDFYPLIVPYYPIEDKKNFLLIEIHPVKETTRPTSKDTKGL